MTPLAVILKAVGRGAGLAGHLREGLVDAVEDVHRVQRQVEHRGRHDRHHEQHQRHGERELHHRPRVDALEVQPGPAGAAGGRAGHGGPGRAHGVGDAGRADRTRRGGRRADRAVRPARLSQPVPATVVAVGALTDARAITGRVTAGAPVGVDPALGEVASGAASAGRRSAPGRRPDSSRAVGSPSSPDAAVVAPPVERTARGRIGTGVAASGSVEPATGGVAADGADGTATSRRRRATATSSAGFDGAGTSAACSPAIDVPTRSPGRRRIGPTTAAAGRRRAGAGLTLVGDSLGSRSGRGVRSLAAVVVVSVGGFGR